MQTFLDLLTVLLPLLYALSAVNYFVFFTRQEAFAEKTITPMLMTAVAVHITAIVTRAIHFERPPIVGLGEALGVIALAVAGVYLYVERVQRNKNTGAFIITMAVAVQVVSSALMPRVPSPPPELLADPIFALHAVIAVLGYSAFTVGAVYGVMYLLLYRALKAQQFGLVFQRLPSLDVLANMGFWASFLGWVALTVTIGLGALMSLESVPNFYADPKFFTTIVVWLVYGGLVITRFVFHWRGARSVYLALGGFTIAVVAMLGSSFLWPSFHSFNT